MKKSNGLKTGHSKNAIEIPKDYIATSLDELKDDLFGGVGTHDRDVYEAELKEEILGELPY
ncbi:MAG: hypothetical protein JWR09_4875 [Mucilaginibacter sp.]|nr:hypothetical protein [Mucilaginibacter sp.]